MSILPKILQNKNYRLFTGILLVVVFITFKYFFRFSMEMQDLILQGIPEGGFAEKIIKLILLLVSYSFEIGMYFAFCYLFTLDKKYSMVVIWFYLAVTLIYFGFRVFFHFYTDPGLERFILFYRNKIFSPMLIIFYLPAYYLYQNMNKSLK